MMALRSLGYVNLMRIATPVRIVGTRRIGRGTWYRIVWADPVPGDIMGETPDGRGLLAEVKTVEHNLRWSDFRSHQPPALSAWNGDALVVWVHTTGVYVMRWGDMLAAGFAPRKSLTVEQARALAC